MGHPPMCLPGLHIPLEGEYPTIQAGQGWAEHVPVTFKQVLLFLLLRATGNMNMCAAPLEHEKWEQK